MERSGPAPAVQLEVLGIGDAFTALSYNTSFLIRSRAWYLVDAPQALLRLLRERSIDPASITHAIITHVHGDHCAGLQPLLLWKRYRQRARLTLVTSRPVFEQIRDRIFPAFA